MRFIPQEIPPWSSCPPAESQSAVWSTVITEGMAERASVLAMSIRVGHMSQCIAMMSMLTIISHRINGTRVILSQT